MKRKIKKFKRKIKKIAHHKLPHHHSFTILLLGIVLIAAVFDWKLKKMEKGVSPLQETVVYAEENSNHDLAASKKITDTSEWKTYQDSQYNFEIKYPSSWPDPQAEEINDSDYVYQYQARFGTTDTLSGNNNDGFSIFVSEQTSSDKSEDPGDCIATQKNNLTNSSIGKNAAESSSADQCLLYKKKIMSDNHDYFTYQFLDGKYEYNLIPALIGNRKSPLLMTKSLPEFEAAADTFGLDFEMINKQLAETQATQRKRADALKQQQASAQSAGTVAGYPIPALGTPICPVKNDKPSYSDTKGKHIDEDCCPDPDEWPNLRCKYKPADYAVMLKGSPPARLVGAK